LPHPATRAKQNNPIINTARKRFILSIHLPQAKRDFSTSIFFSL
jgi:hypothetical protein